MMGLVAIKVRAHFKKQEGLSCDLQLLFNNELRKMLMLPLTICCVLSL